MGTQPIQQNHDFRSWEFQALSWRKDSSALQDPEKLPSSPSLLKQSNLAALDIWKSYIKEGENTDNDHFNGWWNQVKEAWQVHRQGLGKTERDARTRGWALERNLVAQVEKILKAGTVSTIFDALYLIEQSLVELPNGKASQLRSRARAYLGHDQHSDPPLVSRLIRYTHHLLPKPQRAHALLEETFSNLEAKDASLTTAFAIYTLVKELSPQASIRHTAQFHLNALQGKSSFQRAAKKFFYGLSPLEVGLNVAALFVSAGLGNLAKLVCLAKAERVGVTGFKALAAASATGLGVEVGALGSFHNLQLLMGHDPAKLSGKQMADSYKSAAAMVGLIKLFGQAAKLAAPSLAKRLGFFNAEGLSLGGKVFTWGLGHGAGLTGMMASSRLSQAMGWQEVPVGGNYENLANDLLGYGEFVLAQGMAHATLNRLSGGKLKAAQLRQQQSIAASISRLLAAAPEPLSPAAAGLSAGAALLLYPELAQAMTRVEVLSSPGSGMGLKILALSATALAMAAARGKVKPERKRRAFRQMIARLQKTGEKVVPTKAARLAYEIYIQGLSEAEKPSPGTFRKMISGKTKDPEVWQMLEEAGVIEERPKTDPKRRRRAFAKVIARLQKTGEKVTPQKAADLAYEVYIQGLPKAKRPKQPTFRAVLRGKYKDREIWRMLEEAGVIEARVQASVDPERKRWAFRQVVARLQKTGEKVAPTRAADLAREYYNEGIPEEEWPGESTFEAMVSGKRKDPEIWEMLEEAGVIELQVKVSENPKRKRWAFEQVVLQLQKSNKKVTPQEAANLAHQIYIQGLPEAEKPSRLTFQRTIAGKNKDKEIRRMLEAAGVIEARAKIDPKRQRRAFRQVAADLKRRRARVAPLRAASLAHQIYNQGLPESKRPGKSTFEALVSGKTKDPEICRMLEAAGVIEARVQVSADPQRKQWAFERTSVLLQQREEKVGPIQAADLAYQIYNQGLPESKRPSRSTFRGMLSGKKKDSKIFQMLQEAGVLKK